MSLLFTRSSSQYLYAAISISNRVPVTLAAWVKIASTSEWFSVVSVGDIDYDDRFQSANASGWKIRGIAFSSYAEAGYDISPGTSNYHHIAAVFTSGTIQIYVDGQLRTTNSSWSNSAVSIDQLRIGQTVSATYSDLMDGYIEHAAVWTTNLSAEEIEDLYDCSTNPLDIQSSYLECYFPFVDDLADETENITLTAVNFSSYTYESSGISYPSSGGHPTASRFRGIDRNNNVRYA